jgi:hypothetical protein
VSKLGKAVSSTETGIDLDTILDGALANPKPKGRLLTKTQQLRERREKLIALRAKGYTELELAQMTGVSKGTLRKALHPENGTKQKKPRRAAEAPAPKKQEQTVISTPPHVAPVAAVKSSQKPFPTKDRF